VNEWMTNSLFLMPNWKWIGLVIALIAGLLLKSILKKAFRKLKSAHWMQARARGFLNHLIHTAIENPLSWILTCLFWLASIDSLGLNEGLAKYLGILITLIMAFNLVVLLYRATDAFGQLLLDYTRKTENPLDDQLAPMATKVLKVLVVILGILICLQNFGVNVTSLLAGLGIGGLAVAFAAQQTVANLFGSVTIVADRPFQVGDWIRVGDTTEGIVEDIGFRSTRIRTLYNSLITVPNATIANEKIDNMTGRSLLRIRHTIGLTYDATSDQMKHYMKILTEWLRHHPEIDQNDIVVRFVAMGDFSLQILVNFFIPSQLAKREREIQEDFLFFAMKTAEELKLEFAFPTATHYIKPLLDKK
jgi:MscS family membrane protein